MHTKCPKNSNRMENKHKIHTFELLLHQFFGQFQPIESFFDSRQRLVLSFASSSSLSPFFIFLLLFLLLSEQLQARRERLIWVFDYKHTMQPHSYPCFTRGISGILSFFVHYFSQKRTSRYILDRI